MQQPYSENLAQLREILAIAPKGSNLVVAIDGPSGCGKSTLSKVVSAIDERVVVIQMDDFYRPMPEEIGLKLSPEEGFQTYFDWQRLKEQVLIPLSQSKDEISYQLFDWGSKSLGRWECFKARGVVVIEGVYSSREELSEYIDCSIFVDTPESTRRARIDARQQNPSIWIEKWIAAEKYYLVSEKPERRASLVLRGE